MIFNKDIISLNNFRDLINITIYIYSANQLRQIHVFFKNAPAANSK